jgi:hypothetical protein
MVVAEALCSQLKATSRHAWAALFSLPDARVLMWWPPSVHVWLVPEQSWEAAMVLLIHASTFLHLLRHCALDAATLARFVAIAPLVILLAPFRCLLVLTLGLRGICGGRRCGSAECGRYGWNLVLQRVSLDRLCSDTFSPTLGLLFVLMLVQLETAGKMYQPISRISVNIDVTSITDHFMESDVRGGMPQPLFGTWRPLALYF